MSLLDFRNRVFQYIFSKYEISSNWCICLLITNYRKPILQFMPSKIVTSLHISSEILNEIAKSLLKFHMRLLNIYFPCMKLSYNFFWLFNLLFANYSKPIPYVCPTEYNITYLLTSLHML